MPRALWSGSLSFGLVNIPVTVQVAVRDHRPHFKLLHADDHAPIRFLRVRARGGEPVEWKDIVKGYEYSRGRYVVLTKKDFQAAALEKTHRIDILDFVPADDIDDRYFDTPYYLAPAKGGESAYALLREALRDASRTGIAKFVLREKMHLAAIEVVDDAIVLTLIRFADELVDTATLPLPTRKQVNTRELALAKTLVESLAAEWNPEKYTDDYRDNLMKIIKAKAKGKTITYPTAEPEPKGEVVDLMARLRESLEHARERGIAKSRRRAAAKPKSSVTRNHRRGSKRAA
jgi:DNA end-binding protein Ku